jgi:hypothetical protein
VCGGVRARQVTPQGSRVWPRRGASRRGSRRSPARRHGWRRARRPRSAHESACGFTAVVGAAKDMVLISFPSATAHEAPGHGEAAAMRTDLTRRRPTREERGQGPTWPLGSTRAHAGVHGDAGRQVRGRRARMRARTTRRGAADASSSARRSIKDKGRLGPESSTRW